MHFNLNAVYKWMLLTVHGTECCLRLLAVSRWPSNHQGSVCVCVLGRGGAGENEGDKVMSRSDGAFKRHLKYCNYETAARNATVAIRRRYCCVAQAHTHTCTLWYCHTNSETPAQDQDPLSSPRCT